MCTTKLERCIYGSFSRLSLFVASFGNLNGIEIDPKWDESGPGGRQGVPENQQKHEQFKKRKRKHKH